MAELSLRLPDELLSEVDVLADRMGIGRAEHVRQALVRMKADTEAAQRRRRLQDASFRVRSESMAVNAVTLGRVREALNEGWTTGSASPR